MKIIEQKYDWGYALTPRAMTTHLILHHSAASGQTASEVHNYHRSLGWAGIAYHYYVRKDGAIYRGRPENMRGGHTTNWNYCSIGICFEGNFENEPMSEAQKKAGEELVADILKRNPGLVVGKHRDFSPTACPGKFFPFDEILAVAKGEPEGTDVEDDGAADDWAKEATDRAAQLGLFKGDENGNYRWRDFVTRQELATVLLRLMDNK